MCVNVNPQAPRHLAFRKQPLVFDKRHCLPQALRRKNFVAAEPDDVEWGEAIPLWCDSIPSCHLIHISVDCDQDGVIGKRSGTDHFVSCSFGQGFAVQNRNMAAFSNYARDGIRHAGVKKSPKLCFGGLKLLRRS